LANDKKQTLFHAKEIPCISKSTMNLNSCYKNFKLKEYFGKELQRLLGDGQLGNGYDLLWAPHEYTPPPPPRCRLK
jgi:hypothetical protein